MEGSLYQKMKRVKVFQEKEAAKLMKDILIATAFLHSKSPPILHRDLKPENLLLFDGTVKLTDFGWSAEREGLRNTFCGTQEYLAPEMIRGTGHDEKLDIWTLGVLLYELAHGKTPFYVSSHGDVRAQRKMIEQKILKGVFVLKGDLSPELKDVIKAMLTPNKKKRPSAKDLLERYGLFREPVKQVKVIVGRGAQSLGGSERQISLLRAQIAQLNGKVKELEGERSNLKNAVNRLNMDLEASRREATGLREEKERAKVQVQKTKDINLYLFNETKVGIAVATNEEMYYGNGYELDDLILEVKTWYKMRFRVG